MLSLTIILYVIFSMGIGIYASRNINSSSDCVLAGCSLHTHA